MNPNKLKAYAPQARRDFIKAVIDRAAYYGLMKDKIEPITEQGDIAIIAGKPFNRTLVAKRKWLEEKIRRLGFEQVIEAMAYTWFNRFVAIRFMELHGYLDHGYRVLSHPAGNSTPEIVEHAEHVDLPRLNREKVIELKLEGTNEAELYRILMIAQCNALHRAMPFLFEWIGDATELLLPENLLHSDSVIRKLVNEIPEDEWQEVEIIGWLYQFYISEKKDQVIGKVVKSEDIPAATQRFTPNWIVKYMVQNTLGRQWMATYPNSPLKQQMEYYIEPTQQTPEVQEQLKAITPDSLNPEGLTLLDLACGSGHILVEAYQLLKSIYQERGYRAKDIPRLILEKNLYGLEIDDRAAQLAAFALMMKARADDRQIFGNDTQPHVLAIQESKGLNAEKITEALNAPILKTELPPPETLFEEMEEARAPLFSRKNLSVKGDISKADLAELIDLFEHGKTFGSLISVPDKLAEKLPELAERIEDVLRHGSMFQQAAARSVKPLVKNALIISSKYNVVATNPPYMGSKFFNPWLKKLVNNYYKSSKGDLYACFIQRNREFTHRSGFLAMITIPNWMFLSSFEQLRETLLSTVTIDTFVHNGRGVFGSDFGTCSFVMRNRPILGFRATYRRLFSKQGSVSSIEELRQKFFSAQKYVLPQEDLLSIPGKPISYWATDQMRYAFKNATSLGKAAYAKFGMSTGSTAYIRGWHEVSVDTIGFGYTQPSDFGLYKYWAPYDKGGPFRKWFGNRSDVVFWKENGKEIRNNNKSAVRSPQFFCKPHVSWTLVSSSLFGVRYFESGFLLDTASNALYEVNAVHNLLVLLAFLNTKLVFRLLAILNPSVNFSCGVISQLPLKHLSVETKTKAREIAQECILLSEDDWNSHETSWQFDACCVIKSSFRRELLDKSWQAWAEHCNTHFRRINELETQNNQIFLEVYGLEDELTPEVSENQITLYRPERQEDTKRLISYAIGCMMGRYSLDKPGLMYAHSGNNGFDYSQYKTFPADQDGIIPVMDTDWFDDDTANQIFEFIGVVWPKDHLEENLKFVAESLDPKGSESNRETIRRYLATGFYKHHLSMYKKRPIYWLFSSGKERGFQCLVYLHRYNEGTLSRMRTEYVIPLQGKINARIEQLKDDISATSSTSHRKKLEKERGKLVKQQTELQTFDEKLRHYADQRISLDLDDGVKVNYGKFGDLLAEVKAITSKEPD